MTNDADRSAELSSTASLLDDLRRRVEDAAADYERSGAEDVASELSEVERLLRTAQRRLDRLLGGLRRDR